MEEKFNFEIDKLRLDVINIDFNINKKNDRLTKRLDPFASTGSMPDLEDLFSKYEEEENKLILNKLQK